MLQKHSMFKGKAPEISFKEAYERLNPKGRGLHRFLNRIFKMRPDDWYLEKYLEHYKAIKDAEGIKVRIPLSDADIFYNRGPSPGALAIELARKFFLFADLVVFSPAPPWICHYAYLNTRPWPEFSFGLMGKGEVYYNGGLGDFIALHAAMSPLFMRGKVTYLPRPGNQWAEADIGFPKIQRVQSEKSAIIARSALVDLCVEQLVSESLGCHHVLPRTAHVPLITRHISTIGRRDNAKPAHIIMHLKIPRVENATFSELCSIQEDEAESITAFKRSILDAANEASKQAITDEELSVAARRIQIQLIEEPLIRLQSRLKKIENIRRRKWSSYAVIASSVAFVAALNTNPELVKEVGCALGGMSFLKIIDMYFADIEKDVPFNAEATYWLTRIKTK